MDKCKRKHICIILDEKYEYRSSPEVNTIFLTSKNIMYCKLMYLKGKNNDEKANSKLLAVLVII